MDALYAGNHMTGGMPPSACYAPVKDREMLMRLRAARERLNWQELYAGNEKTGGRPPEECFAPLRGGKRRADEL